MDAKHSPHGIEPRQFRRVMSRFATGVTVVTATAGGQTRGMTANAFMSGSLEPPLCVVSVARRARMHALLDATDRFAVNFLAAGQEAVARHYSGRKVRGLDVTLKMLDGLPVLADCAGRILADIAARHDCGDHTLFVGHITWMSADDRPPLVYHATRFGTFEPAEDKRVKLSDIW